MDIFEERSGLSVEDVLATQGPRELKHIEHKKDPDFVLPVSDVCAPPLEPLELNAPSSTTSQKIARKEKVSKTKAAKKSNSDDDSEESDARSTDSEVAKVRLGSSSAGSPSSLTLLLSPPRGLYRSAGALPRPSQPLPPLPRARARASRRRSTRVTRRTATRSPSRRRPRRRLLYVQALLAM